MEKNRSKGRNGEIDFLRFVFATVVVLFHFNATYHYGHFYNGAVGVEFFFLVSGVLMARKADLLYKSAAPAPHRGNNIPEQTCEFLKGKLGVFYTYLLVCAVFQLIFRRILLERWNLAVTCREIIKSIPSFLMINMAGMYTNGGAEIGGSWYLSAMILGMLLLFPLLLLNYEWAAKIIMPIIGIFGLGYVYLSCAHIMAVDGRAGIFYGGMLRGTGELAIGVCAYEIGKKLAQISFSKLAEILLTLVKFICYAVVLVFAYSAWEGKYDLYAFIFCAAGVTLSFSGVGWSMPDYPVTRWLGKVSLPVFLIHSAVKGISVDLFGNEVDSWMWIATLAASYVIAVAVMYISDGIQAFMKKHKNIFIQTA